LDEADPAALEAAYQDLEAEARRMLARTGIPEDEWLLERTADLRYIRQAYELNVAAPGAIDAASLPRFAEGYHDKHALTYGHANRGERVQIVTLRLSAAARLPALTLAQKVTARGGGSEKARRPVCFEKTGRVETPVHDRDRMAPGDSLAGPVIIESLDSTIVVPPDWSARMDERGFILLTIERGGAS
jgi:N-methylhydantoinase A/oxoprolinase/acetone carboxylase beta subunit